MAMSTAGFADVLIGSPPKSSYTDVTYLGSFTFIVLADPPHESDVIQRMSEAYRSLKDE